MRPRSWRGRRRPPRRPTPARCGRRRVALWLPALVFFLAALGALLAYPLRFAGRAEVTQEELTEARQELAELGRQRQDIESRFSDISGTRRAAVAEADPGRRVQLDLQGRARDGEAILALVDALFADPAFADPDLSREARQEGEVAFSLSVAYLPRAAEELARAAQAAEEADAGEVRATPPGLDGGPDGEAAAADAEPGGAP